MTNMFIETANGVYEVKRPSGKVGARSMVMMSKMATADGLMKMPSDPSIEDPALIQKITDNNNKVAMITMGAVFEEWAPMVLPGCVVKGPFTYEDMPGEDQLAIFLALAQETKVSEDFFRIVPAPTS